MLIIQWACTNKALTALHKKGKILVSGGTYRLRDLKRRDNYGSV